MQCLMSYVSCLTLMSHVSCVSYGVNNVSLWQGGAGAAGGNGGDGGDALGLFLPFEYNVIEDSGALTKQVNRSLLDILGGGRAGNGGDGGSGGDGAGNDQGFDGGKLEIH